MAWLEKRRGKYHVCWRDGSRRIKRIAAYADKLASKSMMTELERALARGEHGLVDPFKEHKKRPLTEHVSDYLADLKALGRDDMYRYNVERRLKRLADDCGWKLLQDITSDSFCRWRRSPVISKRVSEERYQRQVGPRTLNQYLDVIRAFCNWCVKPGRRMAVNPMLDVSKVDESADVRRARRALHEEEVVRFLATVPKDYRLVYQFILATGLRRQEVEDLIWGDVKLNAPLPFIQLRAKATKARRADVLPIRGDVAAELKSVRGDAGDEEKVFAAVPTIEEHKAYLTAAGIEWEDSENRRADVHSMRHTFGTMLSKSGVTPREAMSLMRHTDMRLTMKVYTDPRVFDLAGAVEKLPTTTAKAGSEAQQATGTDGKAGGAKGSGPVQEGGGEQNG